MKNDIRIVAGRLIICPRYISIGGQEVETRGVEPLTFWLPARRSSQLS